MYDGWEKYFGVNQAHVQHIVSQQDVHMQALSGGG